MEYLEYLQTELLSSPLNIFLAIVAGYLLWQLLKPPPPPPRSGAKPVAPPATILSATPPTAVFPSARSLSVFRGAPLP